MNRKCSEGTEIQGEVRDLLLCLMEFLIRNVNPHNMSDTENRHRKAALIALARLL